MKKIYRVGGFYASGTYHTHLVEALSPRHAMDLVLAADCRFIRFTKATVAHDIV